MAWEQIGTYEGIPFWADDSLGMTDQDVLDEHLAFIQELKAEIESYGGTASQSFLTEDGRVVVAVADPKDDPRLHTSLWQKRGVIGAAHPANWPPYS